MILYIIKCTIAMGVSWLVYRLLLSQKKSFTLNRIYLLIAIIGSSVAPLIILPSILPRVLFTQSSESLRDADVTTIADITNTSVATHSNPLMGYIPYVVIILSFLFFIRFVSLMIKMIQLSKAPIIDRKEGIVIASINDERTPFSFFKTIFINSSNIQEGISNSVFQHEKYHIQQWHSVDRIVVELIGIVQWMNPFLYLLKKDLINNHEYAADAYAIDQTQDTQGYLSTILSQAAISSHHGFILQRFSHSSSKKRIKMITSIQKKRQDWAYPIAILALIVCLISCSDDPYDKMTSDINIEENTSQVSELKKENKFLTKMGSPAPPPPPVPEIKRPSKRLLEKWANNKTFGLLLDGEIIDHQTLTQFTPDDISLYMVRVPYKKSKLFGKYEYEVQLLTNNGYNKFQLRREKLQEEYYKIYPNGYEYKPKNNNDGKK